MLPPHRSLALTAPPLRSANLFDDPDFNDYKLIVTAEGEATEPRVLHVTKLMLARSSALFLERIRAVLLSSRPDSFPFL